MSTPIHNTVNTRQIPNDANSSLSAGKTEHQWEVLQHKNRVTKAGDSYGIHRSGPFGMIVGIDRALLDSAANTAHFLSKDGESSQAMPPLSRYVCSEHVEHIQMASMGRRRMAWTLKPNEDDEILREALRQQASRFTYCLIDNTELAIGTAIAVNLRQRFFFASAKHLIDNDHELKILARGSLAPATSSDFIARRCDEQLDVGLLELNSDAADRFDFIDGTRLLAEIDAERELPTIVIGYPGQFIQSAETQIADNVTLRVNRPDQLTFRSVVLPQSEWPNNSSLQKPLTRGRDILVDYDPEPQVRHVPPGTFATDVTAANCPKLDPSGMSGGGIWLEQVEERSGGLRVPDVRLIGIQTGWYEDSGWLKGLRIGVWLDMLQTAYPDLREGS